MDRGSWPSDDGLPSGDHRPSSIVYRLSSVVHRPAFDAVAGDYDDQFTETRLGRWLRAAVWERLAAHFRPGMRVIELGCGSGEDAIWLARRGVFVTATDASPAMLAVARRKATAAGLTDYLDFQPLDLSDTPESKVASPRSKVITEPEPRTLDFGPATLDSRLATRHSGPVYDGAFSNFGALNCVADLRPVAGWLARVTRPGGRVVLVLMGPWCLWEIGWHLAHGEVRTALRRLRPGGALARVADRPVRVWYPSPARLRQAFAPWFRPLSVRGVGVFLPPSYLGPHVERWPAAFAPLRAAERRLAGAWPFRWLGDHYLLELERIPRSSAG